MSEPLRIVVLGLSITSSWGNGHATTYRALMRALTRRGHDVLFLERDKPWYAKHRDLPDPAAAGCCAAHLYSSLDELQEQFGPEIADADVVIVGSYVPEGIAVGRLVMDIASGVRAFYDIDTPVTLAELSRGTCEYLSPQLIREYDLYLSFTGGPTLDRLEHELGSPMARALYCCVDAGRYGPAECETRWDLGYLGTYSADRQDPLEALMLQAARQWPQGRFVVAGPQYPADIHWPANVARIEHLPPEEHPGFYSSQRYTLNLTRADMRRAGYSPSVRLFEAAACATPIISDMWPGLDEVFEIGREILTAASPEQVLKIIRLTSEADRLAIAAAARRRVLAEHTADHRARQLEGYINAVRDGMHAISTGSSDHD